MTITFDEYQQGVARTSSLKDGPPEERMYMSAMGVIGELGEITELIKKCRWHGHDLDMGKVDKELGDLLYYIAEGFSAHGASMRSWVGQEMDVYYDAMSSKRRPFSSRLGIMSSGHGLLVLERCLSLGRLSGDYAGYVYDRLILKQPPMPGGPDMLRELLDEASSLILELGLNLADVADHNRSKLAQRYPEGFDSQRSINREMDHDQATAGSLQEASGARPGVPRVPQARRSPRPLVGRRARKAHTA